jgi:hypothetical protein
MSVGRENRWLEGVKKSGLSQALARALVNSQGPGGSAADCPSIFSHLLATYFALIRRRNRRLGTKKYSPPSGLTKSAI